jgi:hypothetical protein
VIGKRSGYKSQYLSLSIKGADMAATMPTPIAIGLVSPLAT